MEKVYHGIDNHQVLFLQGDNVMKVLQPTVYARYVYQSFSSIEKDLHRISTCLSSKRWDGKRPVVVFFQCDSFMKDIAPLIRNRQPKQAVILVTDGEYTANTPIMKSLSAVQMTIGKVPDTIFSLLKRTPTSKRADKQPAKIQCTDYLSGPITDVGKRYERAIKCTGIDSVIDQIHYSNHHDTDVSSALSDIDLLRYGVSEELLVECLPLRKSVEYTTNKKIDSKTKTNLQFINTLQPIVARTRLSLLSVHETLEYIRFSHHIKVCPNIAKCPRDDQNPNLIQSVNDRIRILVCMNNNEIKQDPITSHQSKPDSSASPSVPLSSTILKRKTSNKTNNNKRLCLSRDGLVQSGR
jgi:hypothetical protein